MVNRLILLCVTATFALGVSSCVANEKADPQEEAVEILYNLAPVKQNQSTKASFSEFTGTFGTFAYSFPVGKSYDLNKNDAGIATYINNAEISKVGSVWKGSSTYYWPVGGGTLTFFSYAPYNALKDKVTCTVANGIALTDYVVSATVGNMASETDILVADIAKDLNSNTNPGAYYTSGVPTLFRHKLCTVQFLVSYANEPSSEGTGTGKSVADADKIVITGFELKNIYTSGDYLGGKWQNLELVENFPQSVSSSITLGYDFTSNPTKPIDAVLFSETIAMPQPTNASGRANAPQFVIKYKRGGGAEQTSTVQLYSPTLPMWEPGSKIIYRVTISTKDEYIEFDGKSSAWTNENEGDVNVGI